MSRPSFLHRELPLTPPPPDQRARNGNYDEDHEKCRSVGEHGVTTNQEKKDNKKTTNVVKTFSCGHCRRKERMSTSRRNVPSLHRAFNVEWKSQNETKHVRKWMITSLLDQGANPNEINTTGFMPLGLVLDRKHPDLEIARILLERGANPNKSIQRIMHGRENVERDTQISPLYQMAAKTQYVDLPTIHLLLKFGANPNKGETFYGTTPLQEAVRNGDLDVVRKLLDHPRIRVDATNNFGSTALHYCINYQSKRLDIARLLLDKGAAPNRQDRSALLSAIVSYNPHRKSPPHLPLIELILKYIPQKNPIVTPPGSLSNTALHTVAMEQSRVHDDIARLLLQRGANPNVTDPDGWTPLHVAVFETGRLSMIRLLLDHGADPNKQTSRGTHGHTALHLAMSSQHNWRNKNARDSIIKLLLESGANPLIRSANVTVNGRKKRGTTSLEMNEKKTPFLTTWLGERAFRRQLASKALNSVPKTTKKPRKRSRPNTINIPNNIKTRILSQAGLSSTNIFGRKRATQS
jgi:ankyrin repeat protein